MHSRNGKKLYDGHFHYFTGPKSYYPEKVIHGSPPPFKRKQRTLERNDPSISVQEKKDLYEFANQYGRGVRQKTVREKTKEECGSLPHSLSLLPFRVQGVGEDVSVQDLAIRAVDNNAESSIINCRVRFHAGQVVAVRHNRKRETLSFFLALIKGDILVKQTPGSVEFVDKFMNVLWLDKCCSDAFTFMEAYPDSRNSPLSIIDKVEIDVRDEDDGKIYIISQVEVNRIELLVNGVVHEDEDDVNESESDDEEDGPRRVQLTTRTGRSATRIRLRK